MVVNIKLTHDMEERGCLESTILVLVGGTDKTHVNKPELA
jgi:hypothetical protein